MAGIWIDGFDEYASADIMKVYTTHYPAGDGVAYSLISGSLGRRGGGCLRIGVDGNANNPFTPRIGLVPQYPSPTGATCIVGVAFKYNTSDWSEVEESTTESNACCILSIRQSNLTQVWFRLNSNGTISCYRGTTHLGTSTFTVPTQIYTFLEFAVTINSSSGSVVLYRDGVADATLNLSGQNTQVSGTAAWNEVRFGYYNVASPGGILDILYDDLYILDGSGSVNNAPLGDHRVETSFVVAEGDNTDGVPSTGADNALMVDETAADGDTTYNAFSTAATQDNYTHTPLIASGASIAMAAVCSMARKEDVGSVTIRNVLRIGGNSYYGTARGVANDYLSIPHLWDRSPIDGTTPFTGTVINAAQIGMEKAT